MNAPQMPRIVRVRVLAFCLASTWIFLSGCATSAADDEGDGESTSIEAECRRQGLPANPSGPQVGEPATEARTAEWPRECLAEELPARVTARSEEPNAVPSELELTFAGGVLTSVNGRPCTFCDEQPSRYEYVSLIACSQQYVCETIYRDIQPSWTVDSWILEVYEYNDDQAPPQWRIHANSFIGPDYVLGPADIEWEGCVPADCNARECGSNYCGGSCGSCADPLHCFDGTCRDPSGTGGGGGGGAGGGESPCNTCLDICQGLDGCCTGSGCLCQDACRPSSDCGDSLTYCCGPDGFCFCTDSCPY
jgi:hypothetical protein